LDTAGRIDVLRHGKRDISAKIRSGKVADRQAGMGELFRLAEMTPRFSTSRNSVLNCSKAAN